jgi:Leishmanolysin
MKEHNSAVIINNTCLHRRFNTSRHSYNMYSIKGKSDSRIRQLTTTTTTTTAMSSTYTAWTTLVISCCCYYVVTNSCISINTCTVDASSILQQHRVKHPTRAVSYQHTIEGRSTRGLISNSVVHTGKFQSIMELSKLPLHREEIYHHTDEQEGDGRHAYWVLHATAPSSLISKPASGDGEREQQQRSTDNDNKQRSRSLLRNLYDQFVGQDIPPGSSFVDNKNNNTTINTVNVTTEVEITETIIVDDGGGGGGSSSSGEDVVGDYDDGDNTTGSNGSGNINDDEDQTNDPNQGENNGSSAPSSSEVTNGGSAANATMNVTETVIFTENININNTGEITHNNGGVGENTGAFVGGGIDSSGNSATDTASQNQTSSSLPSNSSSTSFDSVIVNTGPVFQPLRIRAILAEKSSSSIVLNDTERNALFHEMLSPALLAWSSSLRVDPVVGNLTVDVNQLVDGKTCGPGVDSGLPSVKVPIQHIEVGIPDTDLIVYLSLGTVLPAPDSNNGTNNGEGHDVGGDGNNSTTEEEGGDTGSPYRGDGLISRYKEKDVGFRIQDLWGGLRRRLEDSDDEEIEEEERTKKVSIRDYESVADDDDSDEPEHDGETNELNKNETTSINICTGNYLAAASYCSTDQYDRPTAALLHICVGDDFFELKNRERNIMTLMHELAHALGFNSLSMAHFRRPDGTPYTPRDENGEIPDTEVECTGPGLDHQTASVALPSEEVLNFRTVRGGVRVAEIVTPSVVQVVRNQFDCQLLSGAELESGEGLPLSVLGEEGCIGDHWERRIFSSDLMNPIVDDLDFSTRISTLTLAYFADSGWYQVDLSQADVAPGWGRGAGCSFVNDTCVSTTTGEVPPQNAPFFCNEISTPTGFSLTPQDIHGCTPDLSRKAKCSIGQYDLDLPAAYQYFNNTYGADVGGSDSLMDFCPVYAGFENGLCSSAESANVIRAVDIERFGQRNSRCLTGNAIPFQRTMALCLPIACVIEDRSFRIKVKNTWHICEDADDKIVTDSAIITCPDPRRVCPTFFCPYDCLGTGGRCDYQSGQCLCDYEGITVGGAPVVDVCGLTRVNTTDSSHRPFVQRQEQETVDPARPPPDTHLSDYYFDGVEKLRDEPLIMKPWVISLICVSGFILMSMLATILTVKMKPSALDRFPFFQFWKSSDVNNDTDAEFDIPSNVNGEKDKMVATVLVDLRMNGNQRWRYTQRQQQADLNDSIADTEDRLTESEVASDARNESISDIDMSCRQSECETISDHGAPSNDDFDEFHQASTVTEPSIPEEPQVIRRRRIADAIDHPHHECP